MAVVTPPTEGRRLPEGVLTSMVLGLVAAAVVVSGCGRKDAPLPPVIRVAETTRDLGAVQEGTQAVLTWSWPALTTAGGPLPDVEQIEIWRAQIPAGQEPPGTTARDQEIRVQLLEAKGERVELLEHDQLDQRTRGATLVWRDDLNSLLASSTDATAESVVWYGVRTVCCGGRKSRFSNIARLVPETAPAAPQGLRAEAGPQGITLSWDAPDGASVEVERKAEGEDWQQVSSGGVPGNHWTDSTAALGTTWSYRLRSVRSLEGGGVVRGPAGATVTVPYVDVFPPPPPDNVACLPEEGRVRLRWLPVEGVAGYRVSRRGPGEPWVDLVVLQVETSYTDESPPRGRVDYVVRAVDDSGNSSEEATCTTVIAAAP